MERRKKAAIKSEYQLCVDNVLESYEEKFKVRYPFQSRDGKIIKDVLLNYGPDHFIALWKEFMSLNYDWYDKWNRLVKIPHDMITFRSNLTRLLEDGAYKKRVVHIPTHPEFDFSSLVKKA